jgi:ankyrin repeat protein
MAMGLQKNFYTIWSKIYIMLLLLLLPSYAISQNTELFARWNFACQTKEKNCTAYTHSDMRTGAKLVVSTFPDTGKPVILIFVPGEEFDGIINVRFSKTVVVKLLPGLDFMPKNDTNGNRAVVFNDYVVYKLLRHFRNNVKIKLSIKRRLLPEILLAEFSLAGVGRALSKLQLPNEPKKILFAHVAAGDVEQIDHLIKMGADVNGGAFETPLHWAAKLNQTKIAQLLLDNGAELGVKDFVGGSPLHSACLFGSTGVAKVLLRNGAKIKSKDNSGDMPIHTAVESGYPRIVEILIDFNAAIINDSNGDGKHPLHVAIDASRTDSFITLASMGADLTRTNRDGANVVELAILLKRDRILKFLEKRKIAIKSDSAMLRRLRTQRRAQVVDHYTSRGINLHPIFIEIIAGDTERMRKLLSEQSNICNLRRGKSRNSETPLFTALKYGHDHIAKTLLDAGANVMAQYNGNTPLHYAARDGRCMIASLLIDKGADVNAKNKKGDTPLILAAKRGRAELVKILMMNGANPKLANKNNYNALDLATRYGHTAVVSALDDTKADCGRYIRMVDMSVKQIGSEKSLEISCRISKEHCIKNIELSRKGVSLARRGIKLLREEKSCKGKSDLESIMIQFEKDISSFEKIVDRYELQYK